MRIEWPWRLLAVRAQNHRRPLSAWVRNYGQGGRGPSVARSQARELIPLQELISIKSPEVPALTQAPCPGVLLGPLRLRNRHTEAEIESSCPEGETQATTVLAHWQATLNIQIEGESYKINNCQIPFLCDLKLAARRFSLNMCEVTVRC